MDADRSRAYTAAGVDINAGDALVDRIKTIVGATRINGVLGDIGGFGGLFKPDLSGMKEPVLVSSTDGVGTKLKLAIAYDCHSNVGIDLVAMSVNDIIVQGARPLFFLDYFSTGKLEPARAAEIISSIASGCKQASCALLGGETAEMPGMYSDGDYDLAGFCVGIVDNADIVDGSTIRMGDAVIGLASSGVHSNGFSLVRKLLKKSGLQKNDIFPGTDKTVCEVLLAPTTIYVDVIRNLKRDFTLKGMAHITGGGFYHNIPRVLPTGVAAEIVFGSWTVPPVFQWIRAQGNLGWDEMLEIFNCGIGFVLIVSQEHEAEILNRLHAMNQAAWKIGSIRLKEADETTQIFINHLPEN